MMPAHLPCLVAVIVHRVRNLFDWILFEATSFELGGICEMCSYAWHWVVFLHFQRSARRNRDVDWRDQLLWPSRGSEDNYLVTDANANNLIEHSFLWHSPVHRQSDDVPNIRVVLCYCWFLAISFGDIPPELQHFIRRLCSIIYFHRFLPSRFCFLNIPTQPQQCQSQWCPLCQLF